MAAKLVWVNADGTLTCGHSRAVGYPGEDGEYWCHLCAAHVDAALDQELAEVAAQLRRRQQEQET